MNYLTNNKSCIALGFAAAGILLCVAPLGAQDAPVNIEEVLKQYQQRANNPTVLPPEDEPTADDDTSAVLDENNTGAKQSTLELAEAPGGGIDAKIAVLDLKNMDIQDFMKLISQKSGLNVVAGANVKGRITIYLKDIEIRDALRIVLEANDLAYIEEEKIIKVMTAKDFELKYGYKFGDNLQTKIVQLKYANVLDMVTVLNQMKNLSGKVIFDHKSNTLVLMDAPSKITAMMDLVAQVDVPIATEVFDLSYANAKEVAEKINESLTANVGRAKFDERSNRIVVTDTKAKLELIAKIIGAFDIKEKQVLIEAKIMQIILSDEHKMGVDWEAIVSDYHSLTLTNDFDVLATSEKRGTVSVGSLSSDDYTFLLEALETVGETKILSSPSITAINNKEAKILVGSTQPYVTTTTTTPATGPTTTAETVNFIEVGVKLYVTPTIHADDFVTMKIKPEVSAVTSNLTTSENNTIPIVETSEAETTVTIKDNVTIVIGGLIKEENITTLKKVPLLGDVPLLGFAFRNQEKSVSRTELVIFLTPKIISGDAQADAQKADAASQASAVPAAQGQNTP